MCLEDVYIRCDLIDCLLLNDRYMVKFTILYIPDIDLQNGFLPFSIGGKQEQIYSSFLVRCFPFLLQNFPFSLWGRQRHSVTPFQAWMGVSFHLSNGGTMVFKIPLFRLKRSFSFHFSLGDAKAFYTPFPFDKLTDDAKKLRIPFGSGIME